MIRPLRRGHRLAWAALALLLPALFVAALALRPRAPRLDRLPPELLVPAPPSAAEPDPGRG